MLFNRFLSGPCMAAGADALAGGAGGNAGGLDPAIDAAINKALNGMMAKIERRLAELPNQLMEQIVSSLPDDETLARLEAQGGDGNDPNNPDPGAGQPALDTSSLPPEVRAQMLNYDRRFQELEGRFAEEQRLREEAEQAADYSDRLASISNVLAGVQFAKPAYQQMVLRQLMEAAERDPAAPETLIINGLPVKDYLESQLQEMPDLLASRGISGSGNGGPGTGLQSSRIPTMDQINEKTTPEQLKAIGNYAQAVAGIK